MKKITYIPYHPFSESKPESLVFLLHGFGANASDLMPLAYSWAPHLKKTLFVSLEAPLLLEARPEKRAWFLLKDFDLSQIAHDIQEVLPAIVTLVDQLASENNIPSHRIAFVGFSQGAAVALSLGLYGKSVGGVVGYSGFIAPRTPPKPDFLTPTCLVHGDCDPVVLIKHLYDAQTFLKEYKVFSESWVTEGLGHGMSPFGLEKGRIFLQKVLLKKDEIAF
jgi:phospholipase/carboxylesterase